MHQNELVVWEPDPGVDRLSNKESWLHPNEVWDWVRMTGQVDDIPGPGSNDPHKGVTSAVMHNRRFKDKSTWARCEIVGHLDEDAGDTARW